MESIPEGHMYPPNTTHGRTKDAWLDLIDEAQSTIEIASFYWSLRFNELYPYNSSIEVSSIKLIINNVLLFTSITLTG